MMRKFLWVSMLLLCCSLLISCPGVEVSEMVSEMIDDVSRMLSPQEEKDRKRLRQEPEYIRLVEEEESADKEWSEVLNENDTKTNEIAEFNYKWTIDRAQPKWIAKSPEDQKEVESLRKEIDEAYARYKEAKSKREAYAERRLKEMREERELERRREKTKIADDPEYQKLVKEINFAEVKISRVESKEEKQKWGAKLAQLKLRKEELEEQKWEEYQEEKKRKALEEEEGNGGNGGNGGGY